MRVSVDPVACASTGYCVRLAPELFCLDAGQPSRPLHETVPSGLEDLAVEAEEGCPTNAIATAE